MKAMYLVLISLCCLALTGCKGADEPTKLQKVLLDWEKHGGELSLSKHGLTGYSIEKKSDAEAICRVLSSERILKDKKKYLISSPVTIIVSFFRNVGSEEALNVLKTRGLPLLRRIVRDNLTDLTRWEDDLLFILKILAMYREKEDISLILKAAYKPVSQDSYLWKQIFDQINEEHPGWRKLCEGLRSPLPNGFIAVAYLDFVNGMVLDGALEDHPFDSEEGIERLETWLTAADKKKFGYAQSATAALPFLHNQKSKWLLQIAAAHPYPNVRIEAAWAMAKSGNEKGKKQLVEWCLNPGYSEMASNYLKELGFENDIPATCNEPVFKAMSEMCNWLAHPNEFGRPPDEIKLYDTRELYWPPTDDKRTVYLFQYTYNPEKQGEEPDIGIGMVGSITFAFFSETNKSLSPEDVYALHCCWELDLHKDPRAPKKRTAAAGRKILSKYNSGFK
jgi:hypothetical protein